MSDTFDSSPPTPAPIPGWYRDPTGHGDARYWNGVAWTDAVSRGNVTFQSPMAPDEVRVPPIPGSEYRTPPPAAATPPVTPPASPPPRSSGPSILVGIAVAGVLILLGVFVFSIAFDDDEEPPPPTEAPTETTVPAPVPTEAPPDADAPPDSAP